MATPCPPGRRGKLARVQAMAVATREYGLFIGGESTEAVSGEARELAEPATGEPLARVATAGEADVDRAVETARAALAGPWGKTPPNERSRLLHALADALAAGCTVVLKPDSATPLTALRMAELASEVGFPPGAINIVPGPGPTVGAHLVRHPDVDKIAFTGSTATGAEIMRMASETIKRITLELGGKSRVGDPLDPETQMGSLISTEHREKVHGFVELGLEEGAEIVPGGEPG